MSSEDYAAVALSRVPAIGPKLYRLLTTHFGSPSAALQVSTKELTAVAGIGVQTAAQLQGEQHLRDADEILDYGHRHGVVLHVDSEMYPPALRRYDTAPAVLYYLGTADLANRRSIAIVGTRKPEAAGRRQVERLVDPLVAFAPLIISGLAYGIDVTAHRRALLAGLPTVAVMGSGFKHIYPFYNRGIARQMVEQGGGLLTEYPPWQKPAREHFPARNRIVAMLAQLTLVIESGVSGGSIITANMGRQYGKQVGACPGRPGEVATAGCNQLIKSGRAHLIETAEDITSLLEWQSLPFERAQMQLFDTLSEAEKPLVELLRSGDSLSIDQLNRRLGEPPASLAGTLLSLEMRGAIQSLPGHRYRLAGV